MTPANPAVAARTLCTVCALVPPAMAKVDYCFGCWPGGPVTPPPCLRCGSTHDYFTSGCCVRCHRGARPGVGSCLDCYAWGATRHTKWLCRGCVGWRQDNTVVAPCPTCSRTLTLGRHGSCRLCRKQADFGRDDQRDHGILDLAEANRLGQQLFLADLFSA